MFFEAMSTMKLDSELFTQKIRLQDIIISNEFKNHLPRVGKLSKCYRCYKKNRMFDRDIILNKNGILIDGYIAYLVAKMVGLDEIIIVIK